MIPIIVTGHGEFASALEKTMEYVIGSQEDIYFVNFNNGMGNDELEVKIKSIIEKTNSDEIIFLADIAGGTPFSTAVLVSQDMPKSKVFGGCNMPMLFAALELREEGTVEEIAKDILMAARESAIIFENSNSNEECLDDSGI